jgi:F-type H+-transporting ATPase subunit b
MQVLHQIVELFSRAAPTFFLLIVLYLFLKAHLFKPLEKVLEERSARIEGARRSAEATQAAAQEKVRAYQDALKKARTGIYAEQELARRAALEQRAALVRDTRGRANETIRAAKENIAAEMTQARVQLEQECHALASEIVRVVLERRPEGLGQRSGGPVPA